MESPVGGLGPPLSVVNPVSVVQYAALPVHVLGYAVPRDEVVHFVGCLAVEVQQALLDVLAGEAEYGGVALGGIRGGGGALLSGSRPRWV